jgi:phosphohistidine phosphatase
MLFLVHHGDAVGPEIDPRRPLSDRGRAAVSLAADEAARRGAKPDVVWHSGKLRARQTAEAFWKACNPFATLTAERNLQPADPPEWIRERLYGETRSVMLVGHMPHLKLLLNLLVGAREGAASVDFPLHGVVALEPNGETWKEAWRIPSA